MGVHLGNPAEAARGSVDGEHTSAVVLQHALGDVVAEDDRVAEDRGLTRESEPRWPLYSEILRDQRSWPVPARTAYKLPAQSGK